VLKVIPMPADTNGNGDIFGGWVMAQVDLAGSVLPARVIRGRMATVAVKEFIFKQPVRVGDILSFFRRSRASAAPRSRWTSRCMPSASARRASS
jgi:acyl-CoA hydrolase